jgi:hypothetical protein
VWVWVGVVDVCVCQAARARALVPERECARATSRGIPRHHPVLARAGQTRPDLTRPDLTSPDLTSPDLTSRESILYAPREQIRKETAAMGRAEDGETAPWGIISVKSQSVDYVR